MINNEIAEDLKCYDMVFLIDKEELAKQFCGSEALAAVKKRVKIYLPCRIDIEIPTVICRYLSKEEIEFVLKLYYLYDFSDHFILVSENPCYGGLFNYVRTGWLTLNEVFSVLLN